MQLHKGLVATIAAIVFPSIAISAVLASSFLQTFPGQPGAPTPWRPSEWDVTVQSRDPSTWHTMDRVNAQHSASCAAPPATHPVTAYADTVFLCNDHLMTALNANGYGVIYLTPNQLADFSAGEVVIRFDVSTLRTSQRDWIDLWVSPYADHLQLPLDSWLPDLNGPPRNALQIRMDNWNPASGPSQTVFKATVVRNFVEQGVSGNGTTGYETFLTPSATRRDTFELRLSRTRIKFGMPAYNFWWVDTSIPDLGWDKGVIQLGHHSYNPTKSCENNGTCGPNTWHWDNVQISNAAPFTILRADRRYVDRDTAPQVSFPSGAPANARLRFAGTGRNLAVSFDGGASWRPAEKQAVGLPKPDHFQSYWMPIPAGVSAVRFRGDPDTSGHTWMARDISIWALSGAPPPSSSTVDTTGVFRPSNGALYLKSQNVSGFANGLFTFGLPGDKAVVGDWTRKGYRSIGVYRNGTFFLRNSNTNGVADLTFTFGAAGDLPVVGDWNGDGVETIGVYRNGTFFLRNSNTSGPADLTVTLGIPGDLPIAGKWNGGNVSTVGVFRPSSGALFLRNSNTTGVADVVLTYGLPGDKPVVGDWDGNGTDTIGVYRNGTFHLRNSNTNGVADLVFTLGLPSDEPIAGPWGSLQ
jgi:hypothetical protein